MKLKEIITIALFLIGININAQTIKKEVVEKGGIKNNISSTEAGMYGGTDSLKAKKYFDKAIEYSQKEDFKNAETYYLKAIKEDSKFVEVYDNLGRIYRRIGQYDKAISYYKKSLEIYPEGIMAHQNLAVVYGINKEYENAIKEYEEIVKLAPNNAEGYFGLANTYMMLTKFDLAAKNVELTIEIYKKTDSHYLNEGYYLAGLIYYYSKNIEKAKENIVLAKENGATINPKLEKELFSKQVDDESIKLKKAEEYAKYEPKILEDIDWLTNTPLNQDSQVRAKKSAFLIKWLTGSPSVSVEITAKIVTYLDCSECLTIFMSGWTKYALTTNNYNKLDANITGTETVIDFYTKNKKFIEKNKDVEKFIKLKEKGKLKKYIKSNM